MVKATAHSDAVRAAVIAHTTDDLYAFTYGRMISFEVNGNTFDVDIMTDSFVIEDRAITTKGYDITHVAVMIIEEIGATLRPDAPIVPAVPTYALDVNCDRVRIESVSRDGSSAVVVKSTAKGTDSRLPRDRRVVSLAGTDPRYRSIREAAARVVSEAAKPAPVSTDDLETVSGTTPVDGTEAVSGTTLTANDLRYSARLTMSDAASLRRAAFTAERDDRQEDATDMFGRAGMFDRAAGYITDHVIPTFELLGTDPRDILAFDPCRDSYDAATRAVITRIIRRAENRAEGFDAR